MNELLGKQLMMVALACRNLCKCHMVYHKWPHGAPQR